jgi:hypothetical protein
MPHSELGQHPMSTRVLDAPTHRVDTGVDDLAIVDDNSVPPRPVVVGPADAPAKLGLEIRHEELCSALASRSLTVCPQGEGEGP